MTILLVLPVSLSLLWKGLEDENYLLTCRVRVAFDQLEHSPALTQRALSEFFRRYPLITPIDIMTVQHPGAMIPQYPLFVRKRKPRP